MRIRTTFEGNENLRTNLSKRFLRVDTRWIGESEYSVYSSNNNNPVFVSPFSVAYCCKCWDEQCAQSPSVTLATPACDECSREEMTAGIGYGRVTRVQRRRISDLSSLIKSSARRRSCESFFQRGFEFVNAVLGSRPPGL